MPPKLPRTFRPTLFMMTAAIGGLGGLALTWAGTQTALESSFAEALGPDISAVASVGANRNVDMSVAAGEDYWLGRVQFEAIQPAALTNSTAAKSLKVGDQVSIHSGGIERSLEVVAVTRMPMGAHAVRGASSLSQLDLVSLREVGRPDAPLVRWLLEPGAEPADRRTARAL